MPTTRGKVRVYLHGRSAVSCWWTSEQIQVGAPKADSSGIFRQAKVTTRRGKQIIRSAKCQAEIWRTNGKTTDFYGWNMPGSRFPIRWHVSLWKRSWDFIFLLVFSVQKEKKNPNKLPSTSAQHSGFTNSYLIYEFLITFGSRWVPTSGQRRWGRHREERNGMRQCFL